MPNHSSSVRLDQDAIGEKSAAPILFPCTQKRGAKFRAKLAGSQQACEIAGEVAISFSAHVRGGLALRGSARVTRRMGAMLDSAIPDGSPRDPALRKQNPRV